MKKGKVLGKKQLILAVMVVALGASVWFNMRYSGGNTKYLGETQYVDNNTAGAVETSAGITDYFTSSRDERDKNRKSAQEDITEAIKNAGGNSAALSTAAEMSAKLAARQSAESNIEALLKAKGFSEALAIIGDNDVNIVVRSDTLTAQQTIQIQDIAAAQSGYSLDKIKILTVK